MKDIKQVEWLIIGAGPAGLQFAYFCQQHNIDYLVLEKTSSPGAFFKKFPRHKQLTSINKIYTGSPGSQHDLRWDWNSLLTAGDEFLFKKYSQDFYPKRSAMVNYLKEFAKRYQLKIKFRQDVTSIEKGANFVVKTGKEDRYSCQKLFIATGMAKAYIPNIPGILFARTYENMLLDPKHYKNKKVLIIGKKNSALETANNLLSNTSAVHLVSPNPPKIAWRSHYTGDVNAANTNFLEACQFKTQNVMLNASVEKIKFNKERYHVTLRFKSGKAQTQTYDEVIACTGFQFNAEIFSNTCKPALTLDDRYPFLTSSYESTNVPGLYFLGALMHARDYQKKNSGFVHGFRHNIAFLFKLLSARKKEATYPALTFQDEVDKIAAHIIQRINHSASLWQQPGYLTDAVVYEPATKEFLYYCGISLDFLREGGFMQNCHFFTVTLEYGQERIEQYADIFAIKQIEKQDYEHAHLSTSLHPVIRHYYNSHPLSEHHLIENFENVWITKAEYVEPLIEYLNREMAPVRIEQAIRQNESQNGSE